MATSVMPSAPPAEQWTPRNPIRGPSALQRVVSMTRQRDLPPKEPEEDDKHLREYLAALMQSLENDAAKERAKMTEQRRHEAELVKKEAVWKQRILPDWRSVLGDAKLRRTWWEGSMPARFRATLWSACIGNALAIGRSSYLQSLSLAQSHLASGQLPTHFVEQIEAEMDGTLRRVNLFQRDGPMRHDLRNVLLAYSVFHCSTPRYPAGSSWPAAMLLISMPAAEAFVCLANLVEKSYLKAFYLEKEEEMAAHYRIFGTLLADAMPQVYRNFISHDIRPSLYLDPWLTTGFARFFPVDTVTRLFDVFLLEGDSFPFRAALAVLETLEARLLHPDAEAIAAVFAGQDRGARAVVARSKGLSDETEVEVEDLYVALTGGEDRIFRLLEQREWREGTWERLVERQMP